MARREEGTIGDIARQIRDEARHQLRGFPREAKRQLRGFGGEATYQLGHGWGKEIARQIFGPPKGRRGRQKPTPVALRAGDSRKRRCAGLT